MSRTTVQQAISTILAAVSGVENVQSSYLYRINQEDIEDDLLDTAGDDVHMWFLRRKSTQVLLNPEEPSVAVGLEVMYRHAFTVEGFYNVKTNVNSESTFQAIVDAVLSRFSYERTLSGTAWLAYPMQLRSFGEATFAGVLCHIATMEIEAIERAAITPQ